MKVGWSNGASLKMIYVYTPYIAQNIAHEENFVGKFSIKISIKKNL